MHIINLEKVKSIIRKIESFVKNTMIEDVEIISKYYSDYFKKGESYPYFMTYGTFDKYEDPEITYVKPAVRKDNIKYNLEPDKVTEQIALFMV